MTVAKVKAMCVIVGSEILFNGVWREVVDVERVPDCGSTVIWFKVRGKTVESTFLSDTYLWMRRK